MSKPFTLADLGPNAVVISHTQALDGATYRRLRDEASRRGVPFQIVSDAQYHEALGTEPPGAAEPVIDQDGCVTASDGTRTLVIARADVESRGGHRRYLEAKQRAKELNVEVRIAE
jgi:hypothetical protein